MIEKKFQLKYLTHTLNVLKLIPFICLFFAAPSFGQQKESDRLKAQQRELEKKIGLTQKLLETTAESRKNLSDNINLIERKIHYRQALLDNLALQQSKLNSEITKLSSEIAKLEIEVEQQKLHYKLMIIQAYKMRNSTASLLFVLSSESFNQANKRLEYLEQLAKYRSDQIRKIQASIAALEAQQTELVSKKQEKDKVTALNAQEQRNYVRDREKQKQTIAEMQGKEEQLKKELAEQRKKSKDIQNAINAAINKEILAEKKKKTTSKETKEIALSNKGFEDNKGRLPWPVKTGEITKGFGKQPHPVHVNVFTYNNGVDITTVKGSTVRAVYEGVVSSVIVIPGAGKAVIIAHGNYRTIYSNLQETYVKAGEQIKVKQEIGALLINNSGNSDVHFEIRKITPEGQISNINPTYWLYK
ncbi:murein hydrolase activator EnvC family protein [Crocinitomix algicola]|uniref:murein hydrolase activator EnvC family protein n=1 Tax=Crocinitomix algicola TaxID=1740263 RepID=UPI00082A272A|nr:peptidoglycan DD-metalloendopeptidase family protein [Crocinitomix algicola]